MVLQGGLSPGGAVLVHAGASGVGTAAIQYAKAIGGLVAGSSSSAPLGLLLAKRVSVIGTVLRARPLEEKLAVTRRFAREVLPFLASGACRPVIDSRYAFDDVTQAHRHMESNANVGKLVLSVGS